MDDKAKTDDMQGSGADLNCFGAVGEQPDEPSRNNPGQACPDSHDSQVHPQCRMIDFSDTSVFSRAEIIAHQRPGTLNDTVGGEVDKRLQLIVDAQDKNVFW